MVSLIVRAGGFSPSNDPFRRVLHIDSANVECERLRFLRDGSETLISRVLERFGGFVPEFSDIAKRP